MSLIKRIYVNCPKIGLVTMSSLSLELCQWINSKKVLAHGISAYSFAVSVFGFVREVHKFTNQS